MNKGVLTRILVCIFGFGICLYSYVDKQNEVTRLRLEIPYIANQIKDIRQENTRLQYEIDQFENPQHLMELARHSEYSNLKQPFVREIVTVQEGLALGVPSEDRADIGQSRPKVTLAIGAK